MKSRPLLERALSRSPELLRGAGADAGEEARHALEGDLVTRVHGKFQKRGDVLHMRLLEETEPAGDRKGNAVARELHLQFHGVIVGAVEDGNLVQIDAFLAQIEDALRDEERLLVRVGKRDEAGLQPRVFAHGLEVFLELPHVAGDGGICHLQDRGDAAVVRLDLVNFCGGIAFGEIEDVLEICPAPRVDRLRIVANNHHVAMMRGKHVDEVGLDFIGVLVFIHEEELELPLVMLGDRRIALQKAQRLFQEVIKIEGIGGFFLRFVAFLQGR